jgi:uncharacterized protein YjbJ (UPF0337 family)
MAIALQNCGVTDGEHVVRDGRRIMNRDELKGKAEKAKGFVKEETGEVLNDPELEAEGKAERAGGKLREGYGRAKEKISDTVDDIAGEDEDK